MPDGVMGLFFGPKPVDYDASVLGAGTHVAYGDPNAKKPLFEQPERNVDLRGVSAFCNPQC